jgi:glycosyltransferase involved in cell wall biosynthesis
MSEKRKVLILDNDLIHYRIPIYNILGNKFDLTHACCYPKQIDESMNFKRITLHPYTIGGFQLQHDNIFKLCQDFDAVICQGDIHYLQYATLPLRCRRKFKIAFWGIGVSASYDKHFDAETKWDNVRDFFYKRADAQVFYTDYPIEKYLCRGYKRETLFVAPNTVEVEEFDETLNKTNILFIGTLYAEKGIMHLLEAYKKSYLINRELPVLDIIGKGPDSEKVRNWIDENHLQEKVIMHGAIYDKKQKARFFERSLACISPLQAGLSVLESQGYSTAFVTTKDAITGGEIFNIQNGTSGVLLDNISQLSDTILDIANAPKKYVLMGQEGRKHYLDCRKPSDMAQGFIDTVEYMLRNK